MKTAEEILERAIDQLALDYPQTDNFSAPRICADCVEYTDVYVGIDRGVLNSHVALRLAMVSQASGNDFRNALITELARRALAIQESWMMLRYDPNFFVRAVSFFTRLNLAGRFYRITGMEVYDQDYTAIRR